VPRGLGSLSFEIFPRIPVALAPISSPRHQVRAADVTAPRRGSSGVEGTLILIAAVSIGVAAVDRLISPKPLRKSASASWSPCRFFGELWRRASSELNFRISSRQTRSSRNPTKSPNDATGRNELSQRVVGVYSAYVQHLTRRCAASHW
jgi:hypothetical protein